MYEGEEGDDYCEGEEEVEGYERKDENEDVVEKKINAKMPSIEALRRLELEGIEAQQNVTLELEALILLKGWQDKKIEQDTLTAATTTTVATTATATQYPNDLNQQNEIVF